MEYRALIIEDDHALASVLRMKLERDGHKVTIAPTQHDAYHLLDDHVFDFVLLDLRLPTHEGDMEPHSEVGFDILDHIRDRFTQDQLPVLVMTAYEETSHTAVRALKAKANDYIIKPFDDSPESFDTKLVNIVRLKQRVRFAETVFPAPMAQKEHEIVFKKNRVEVDGIAIKGRYADLIWLLGKRRFEDLFKSQTAEGQGWRMKVREIADAMGVQEHSVRQYVTRFRKWIAAECERRGMGRIGDEEIVRNTPWKGYELNRETCRLIDG